VMAPLRTISSSMASRLAESLKARHNGLEGRGGGTPGGIGWDSAAGPS